ncbi:MAG: tRNA pseudouridine(55) synthase TruB [Planctomycetes bacterium]|nr:tRNA pseudouridine(55) synthase TruB [Planctomycetota bacterium]
MPRYTNKDLHGLIVIDKPVGFTSMDVVRRLRRAAGNCKTGHAGTLDPLASGVLVCAFGRATRAIDRLMALTKVYETTVDLSAFTETDDAEGARNEVAVETPPSREDVARALEGLTGTIEQTPPAYSALKVDGRPAYKYARKGQAVELKPRKVRVDTIELLSYAWPELDLRVTCGKGTYIRSLARQIGGKLGTGGHLKALRRTAVGPYTLAQAVGFDALPALIGAKHVLPVPEEPARGVSNS